MLISFTVENWMSFRERAHFSMLASRERQHGERLPKLDKYQTRVLPIAVLYGGNASGKTNFFRALNFCKRFVVFGYPAGSPIPVEPYRLDAESKNKASKFGVELLIGEDIYEYSFSATREVVITEKLIKVSASSEKVLFNRQRDQLELDSTLRGDTFLQFAFRGTRDNQLFVNNAVSQKVDHFRPVYDWFKDRLDLVAPDSRFKLFEEFLDDSSRLYSRMNDLLPLLDTGIARIGGIELKLEDAPIPPELREKLEEELAEGTSARLRTNRKDRFVVMKKKDKLEVKKLVTSHRTPDGREENFDLAQESDGSQRLIDLLPAFLKASAENSDWVFVIDEIDRSLHTLLTRRLIESYLASCSPNSRAQMLITTHDVLLMDQNLFRRDEMWVVERDDTSGSRLIAFSDYKDVRYDKDIRKSYLQGRLGGIPKLLLAIPEAAQCVSAKEEQDE
jgi:AAA15 family ATPase/GTPase